MKGRLRLALYLLMLSRFVSRSAISEPIMPPGRPGPMSREFIRRLRGEMYRPRKSSMNSWMRARTFM